MTARVVERIITAALTVAAVLLVLGARIDQWIASARTAREKPPADLYDRIIAAIREEHRARLDEATRESA